MFGVINFYLHKPILNVLYVSSKFNYSMESLFYWMELWQQQIQFGLFYYLYKTILDVLYRI